MLLLSQLARRSHASSFRSSYAAARFKKLSVKLLSHLTVQLQFKRLQLLAAGTEGLSDPSGMEEKMG